MKKVLSVLVILLCVFFIVGCKKKETKDLGLVEDGKLIVVTSSDYAPYDFINLTKTGQDKFVGSDITLAKYLADKLGLQLVIKAMDFNALLTALDSGKADLAIAGLSYTEERAAYMFSSCYYGDGDGGQIVVTLKDNSDKYNSLESLNVKENKIAAQNGALQVGLVKSQLPNASLLCLKMVHMIQSLLHQMLHKHGWLQMMISLYVLHLIMKILVLIVLLHQIKKL